MSRTQETSISRYIQKYYYDLLYNNNNKKK
jgi:hypothetical protein